MLKDQFKKILLSHYAGNPSPDLTADIVADDLVQTVLEWVVPYSVESLIEVFKKLQEAK